MKTEYETQLNNEQLNALYQTQGPVLVTAGAGSGKTRLLTYRIAYLIKEKRVSPSNILAITFTNKAAKEMQNRLQNMIDGASEIWVSTFHSMCTKILRRNISNLRSQKKNLTNQINYDSNFSIYADSDKQKALKEVVQKLGITEEGIIQKADWHISNAKNNNINPWEYQKLNQATKDIDDITKIYVMYQSYLENNNALDFDDLLIKTYELFNNFPEILARYQERFEYIHVDEFQDTNVIQYQLVKLLGGKHKNVFVVGDEDQCIYGWRGANIRNILDFRRDFENCKCFKLEQNYRSTKQILTTANNLIKHNFQRNEKTLWTDNTEGVKIEYKNTKTEFEEADYVAFQIKNLVNGGEYNYKDIAVLMRLNAQSAALEEKFLNYNIPYQMFGGYKFFERAEIKNIVNYLRMFANPMDSSNLVKIINFPKRGIGDSTINTLLEVAEIHNTTPINIILNSDEYMVDASLIKKLSAFRTIYVDLAQNYKKLLPAEFVKYLVSSLKLDQVYNALVEEEMSKLLNIDNFILLATNYFNDNPQSTIAEFLQSITLISDIDNMDDKSNSVVLATVHSVKGLEFKVVFIVGLEEEIFPIVRFKSSADDLEEERRLMYVAITRAERMLFVTSSKSRFMYGKRKFMPPSRFVGECGLEKEEKQFSSPVNDTFQNFKPTSYSLSTPKDKPTFSLYNKSSEIKHQLDISAFTVGATVSHPKFGVGVITSNDGIKITKCISIKFKDFGLKTLSIEYAPIQIIKGE